MAYDEYDEYDNPVEHEFISVTFALCRSVFEDISVVFDLCREFNSDISVTFQVNQAGSYNFQSIPVVFEVSLGVTYENIPIVFSIQRAAQNFASYIMQKLYCTTSEVGTEYNDLELLDWNVKPNQTWFVQVDNTAVTLYESQTDLEAGTNAIAVGIADSSLNVLLEYVDEYEGDVEFYYPDVAFHLTLSEIPDEYDVRWFKIKPLTDLSEIRDPIYNNSNIAIMRGEAELALHTFAVLGRSILLGTHIPELEVGDVANLTSVRRGVTDEKSQILSQTISGTVSEGGETSLVTSISVANYVELSR